MSYKLMVDPTPRGWAYGFPKALPEEAVLCGGKEYDLYINPQFDLETWVAEQGYPKESFQYYSSYPQEITEQSSVGSDEGRVDYYTPGSDPQV